MKYHVPTEKVRWKQLSCILIGCIFWYKMWYFVWSLFRNAIWRKRLSARWTDNLRMQRRPAVFAGKRTDWLTFLYWHISHADPESNNAAPYSNPLTTTSSRRKRGSNECFTCHWCLFNKSLRIQKTLWFDFDISHCAATNQKPHEITN